MAASFGRTPAPAMRRCRSHDQCPVRAPIADHLLAPQNAAFLLIDYQPSQLAGVRSMDQALLVENTISTVKTIKTFC